MIRQLQCVFPFGLVCRVASITALIRVASWVGFRPRPGNLPKRLDTAAAEALSPEVHGFTVHAPFSGAISISVLLAATAKTIRQRNATCCGVPRAASQR